MSFHPTGEILQRLARSWPDGSQIESEVCECVCAWWGSHLSPEALLQVKLQEPNELRVKSLHVVMSFFAACKLNTVNTVSTNVATQVVEDSMWMPEGNFNSPQFVPLNNN